ncbi:hypothetical protein SLS54_006450 [Diplodia seriata]
MTDASEKPADNIEHHEDVGVTTPDVHENFTALVKTLRKDQVVVISIINVMPQFLDQYPELKEVSAKLIQTRRLPPTDWRVKIEFQTIVTEVEFQKKMLDKCHPGSTGFRFEIETWLDLFKCRKRVAIGVGIAFFQQSSVDFIAENGIDGLDSDEDDGIREDHGTTGVVLSNDISLDADIILDPLLAHSPPPFPSVSHDDPGPLSPFISLTSSASWLADVERLHSIAISTPQSTASTPGRPQRPNQWPLPVEEEAMLLRYFIENISRFTHNLFLPQFDVSEPIQYFRVDIPQRARTNATLANAMLALSSRILQWKAGYSPHVADRYYQKCLEALIPALGDEALVMDDTLLAATIFLRMLEEMDC